MSIAFDRNMTRKHRRSVLKELRRIARAKELLLQHCPQCMWCGRPLDADSATLEHIVPRSLGGKTKYSNCALACHGCNCRRGNQPMQDFHANPRLNSKRRELVASWNGPLWKYRKLSVQIRAFGAFVKDGELKFEYQTFLPRPRSHERQAC